EGSDGTAARSAPRLDENGFHADLAELTLFQICERYGSLASYKIVLACNEQRERALKLRLSNLQQEGTLVSFELVKTHVLGLIDATNRRLLGDAAKTLTRRLNALAR